MYLYHKVNYNYNNYKYYDNNNYYYKDYKYYNDYKNRNRCI